MVTACLALYYVYYVKDSKTSDAVSISKRKGNLTLIVGASEKKINPNKVITITFHIKNTSFKPINFSDNDCYVGTEYIYISNELSADFNALNLANVPSSGCLNEDKPTVLYPGKTITESIQFKAKDKTLKNRYDFKVNYLNTTLNLPIGVNNKK